KSANQTGPLNLAPGETFLVDYTITVSKIGPTDSDWHVTGSITVTHDNTTRGALLSDLGDVVSPAISASIHDCEVDGTPVDFPASELTLDVGETLTCEYDAVLPDASSRTNTATATQQNHSYDKDGVGTQTGTTLWSNAVPEPVTFSSTPANETDECATVSDTYTGEGAPDEETCASKTYDYTRAVLAPEGSCTDFTVDNTATVTPDDDPPESDNWSIPVDVRCPEGCTLTLGYWKTHNPTFTGGAPPDGNWLNVTPFAEWSGFFTQSNSYPTTGPNTPSPTAPGTPTDAFSWFNVFWTAPKGNAYYNLAQQYMAAKLNILNGADPSAITTPTDLIAQAEGYFSQYKPADLFGLKGSFTLRQNFISLAGTLGQYNEGLIGPGHCSEDGTATLQVTK
ncbi:MAG TPA: hypothetical protein VLB49_11945, partial [Gemmatimonadales bacterium]|nr:hypothetical protein [Gemmatimonadales bacterium]